MELLLFNIGVFFLVRFDMKMYMRQITPLTIIASIYTILIDLNNLFIVKVYGFFEVKTVTLISLFVFFTFIFFVDILFSYIYIHVSKVAIINSVRFYNYRVCVTLFCIGLLAYAMQFVRLYSKYGLSIKGMNGGILGHLSSIGFIMAPVALDMAIKSCRKKKIFFNVVGCLMMLIISMLFGGKYVIFINLTYFVMYFLLKRDRKLKFEKIIKVAVLFAGCAFGVFYFIYYVVPRITGQYLSTMEYAIRHMFEYLLGPIIANNYTMIYPGKGDIFVPLTVFINIGKAILGTGNYVSSIYSFIFPVHDGLFTNVSGFFGESLYCLGWGGALIYVVIVFSVINLIYLLYRAKNKYYLSFCFSSAILCYLFFGNFLTVSGVVLPLIYAVILDTLSYCRFGKFHL